MRLRDLKDVEAFKKVIRECVGHVWLESIYGDYYDLKSEFSAYMAMADLLRDEEGKLELFAQLPEDKMRLVNFVSTLRTN